MISALIFLALTSISALLVYMIGMTLRRSNDTIDSLIEAVMEFQCSCGRFVSPDDILHIDHRLSPAVVERHARSTCEIIELAATR